MLRVSTLISTFLLFSLLGCQSEDRRLPQKLLDEASELSRKGRPQEAKAVLERITGRYADSPEARQAAQDIFIIDGVIKRELREKQRQVRAAMQRTMHALTRYKTKNSEYPRELTQLFPEYLDQVPESPWGHPFFYRPFVPVPIEDVPNRKGGYTQRLNLKLESYHLACLGTDIKPGGEDLASDILVINGEFAQTKVLPGIPQPQPVKLEIQKQEKDKDKDKGKDKDKK